MDVCLRGAGGELRLGRAEWVTISCLAGLTARWSSFWSAFRSGRHGLTQVEADGFADALATALDNLPPPDPPCFPCLATPELLQTVIAFARAGAFSWHDV
jgi:hypothetical protein